MTPYATENPNWQSAYSSSGALSEQNGWQAYYNYAQHLYSVGYPQQAQEYYAYAQQLYNAELEREQRQSVSDARHGARRPALYQVRGTAGAPPTAQQGAASPSAEPPAWEAYYNYAQQLYQSGNQEQAKVYYEQAERLYRLLNEETARPAAVSASPSYAPEQPGAAVSASPSYAPRQSVTRATGVPRDTVVVPVPSHIAEASEQRPGRLPRRRPRRSWRRLLKIWTALFLLGLAGSYAGLFLLYEDRGGAQRTNTLHQNAALGAVQAFALDPVLDVLAPAFEKTVRLSVAAQPLLYELKLRDTLPVGLYSKVLAEDRGPQGDGVVAADQTTVEDRGAASLGEHDSAASFSAAAAAGGASDAGDPGASLDVETLDTAGDTAPSPLAAATEDGRAGEAAPVEGAEADDGVGEGEPAAEAASEASVDDDREGERRRSRASRRSRSKRARERQRRDDGNESARVRGEDDGGREARLSGESKRRRGAGRRKPNNQLGDDPLGNFEF